MMERPRSRQAIEDAAQLLRQLINRMPKASAEQELNRSRGSTPSRANWTKGPGSPRRHRAGKAPPKTRSLASNKSPKNAPEGSLPPKPMPPGTTSGSRSRSLAATDQRSPTTTRRSSSAPARNVELVYSGDVKLDDLMMRFRIEAGIRSDVDARNIEPLHVPRSRPARAWRNCRARSEVGGDGTTSTPPSPTRRCSRTPRTRRKKE